MAIGFKNEAAYDRARRAIRYVEKLMNTPGGGAQVPINQSQKVDLQVVGRIDSFGFYPAVTAFRHVPEGFVDPTTTTTTPTTTTTTTTPAPTSTTPDPCATTTGTTTTTTEDPNWINGEMCLVWEINRRPLGYGCRFQGIVVAVIEGIAIITVYSGRGDSADCITSPISSLPSGGNVCKGSCKWGWEPTDKKWNLVSSSCCFNFCNCDEPQFCPSSACAITETSCVSAPPVRQPNCTCINTTTPDPAGTTTPGPTTTTTVPAGHCTGCRWNFLPGVGFRVLEVNCNNPEFCGAFCLPPAPGTPTVCVDVVTACSGKPGPGPTPPPCKGGCTYVSSGTGWHLVSVNCSGGCNSGSFCMCYEPSGSPGPCGSYGSTDCRCLGLDGSPETTTFTTPYPGYTSTTTIPPCTPTTRSAGCAGSCYWTWNTDLGDWAFQGSNCAATCPCPKPTGVGKYNCDTQVTNCQQPGTSTTTTTATTTPTTSTPNPCRTVGLSACVSVVGGCAMIDGSAHVSYNMSCVQRGCYATGGPGAAVGGCTGCGIGGVWVLPGTCANYPIGSCIGTVAEPCDNATTTTTTTTSVTTPGPGTSTTLDPAGCSCCGTIGRKTEIGGGMCSFDLVFRSCCQAGTGSGGIPCIVCPGKTCLSSTFVQSCTLGNVDTIVCGGGCAGA